MVKHKGRAHILFTFAMCTNTNLYYIHPDPLSLKEAHLDSLAAHFVADILKFEDKQGDIA